MFVFPGGTPSPAVLTYIGSTPAIENAATYTFAAHAIGTAAADRLVIVCPAANGGSGTISSVTCGGVAMNAVVTPIEQVNTVAGIYSLLVTTGTTADIVVTYASSRNRSAISVYTLNNLESTTAYHTATGSAADTDTAVSINYQDGGAVIGVAHVNGNRTATWTNLTENYDSVVESTSAHTSASKATTTGATGETITVTFSGANDHVLAVASWR